MDFSSLVRRDHDDLDHALRVMVDTTTPRHDLDDLVDVFRLALAVHYVAEARALDTLLRLPTRPPNALRPIVAQLREEHAAQQAAADELARIEPGTGRWYDIVLQLRIDVLDHATREGYIRTSLEQHVPPELRRMLAARFATERLNVLATTSPLEIARNVRAA